MSNYNGNGSGSSSDATFFPPFAELIEQYCDRNPKERTKFLCPVCNGGNLSVNFKTGKWDCMSEQSAEHRQEICQILNERYKNDNPLSSGNGSKSKRKPKTGRQQRAEESRAADLQSVMGRSAVELKVEELAYQFDPETKRGTLAALTVEIAAWAKAGGHDVYGSKMMLKEAIERQVATLSTLSAPVSTSLSTGQNTGGSRVVNAVNGNEESIDIEELLASVRELKTLEFVGGDRLDPFKLFPFPLAQALVRAAAALPCPVEALITPLLAICSRLIGTSSIVSPRNGWTEPLVFWGMVSAITGSMKSATLATVMSPLIRFQAQAEHQYEKAMDQWNADRVDAKKHEEEFELPEPKKVEFYIDDATFEAVGQGHKENPRGILLFIDELDAFFAGHNKHRSGGKGDDAQRWMSLNGGAAIKVNRLSRKLFVEKTCVPIVGTIQPETIIPILRDTKSNTSGMNSRWNYCNVPFPSPLDYTEDDTAILDLQSLLLDLYKRLMKLPGGVISGDGTLEQTTYLFSQDGYQVFHKEWMPYIVQSWDREQHQGFKAVLAKQRGFAARNVGLLYLINRAMNGDLDPARRIPVEQVKGGIAIAQFFCNQAKGLFGLAGIESQDQDWTPILMRLKEASLKAIDSDGWITPRDAKRKTRLVTSSDHAKSIFAQLHEAGIGELDTSTSSPRWKWTEVEGKPESAETAVDNVDKLTGDWLSGVDAGVDTLQKKGEDQELLIPEPTDSKDVQEVSTPMLTDVDTALTSVDTSSSVNDRTPVLKAIPEATLSTNGRKSSWKDWEPK
jgi:hypothetical protein